MAWYDNDKLPWMAQEPVGEYMLKSRQVAVGESANFLRAMQQGQQQRQQAIENQRYDALAPLNKQMMEDQVQGQALDIQSKLIAQKNELAARKAVNEATLNFSKLMKAGVSPSNPVYEETTMKIFADNGVSPAVAGAKPIFDMIGSTKKMDEQTRNYNMKEYGLIQGLNQKDQTIANQKSEFEAKLAAMGAGGTPPEQVKIKTLRDSALQAAELAKARGDIAGAAKLTKDAEDFDGMMKSGGMSVTTADGTVVQVGGTKNMPSTQAKIQDRLMSTEKVLNQIDRFREVLSADTVGAWARGKDLVMNKGLANLFPDMADQKVISAQTANALLNAQLVPLIKEAAQVSNQDYSRYLNEILPGGKLADSYPHIMGALNEIQRTIKSNARVDYKNSGNKGSMPFHLQTPEEIKSKFPTFGELVTARDKGLVSIDDYTKIFRAMGGQMW